MTIMNMTNNETAETILKDAGLIPTKPRKMILSHIFKDGHRHFSADDIFTELRALKKSVSLASVYNTLHSFDKYGIIKRIAVPGNADLFDTDTSPHVHIIDHHEGTLEETKDIDAIAKALNIPESKLTRDFQVVVVIGRPSK